MSLEKALQTHRLLLPPLYSPDLAALQSSDEEQMEDRTDPGEGEEQPTLGEILKAVKKFIKT